MFVQLPQADDAGVQSWDVVHIRQRPVLAIQAPKEDGSPPTDLHARTIAELHRPGDAAVELSERQPNSNHVVACIGI
jgi:hypothetical protein